MMEAAFGQTNSIQVEREKERMRRGVRERSFCDACARPWLDVSQSAPSLLLLSGFGLLGGIDSLINKMSAATFPSSFRNIIML